MLDILGKESYNDKDLLFAEKHLLPHLDLIYRCALRLTKNKPDAEDLTQETFVIALKNYGQIKDISKCKNWLFSILRNLFLKVVNKNKKHQVVDFDAVSNFIYELTNLSDDLLLDELKVKVREVLENTESRHRLPIELFYFKKLSYMEIAKELNLPIGTVMSRIARAKVHLRKELKGFHYSEGE
ncbi:MAG: RNA polymerase sigma factor [Nitrospinales bacterium]